MFRNKIKVTLAIILSFGMIVAMVTGCSNKKEEVNKSTERISNEESSALETEKETETEVSTEKITKEVTTEAFTETATEKPTEKETEVPIETPTVAPIEVPTKAPVVIKPTEAPTKAPVAVKPTETPTKAPVVVKPTEAPTKAPAVNQKDIPYTYEGLLYHLNKVDKKATLVEFENDDKKLDTMYLHNKITINGTTYKVVYPAYAVNGISSNFVRIDADVTIIPDISCTGAKIVYWDCVNPAVKHGYDAWGDLPDGCTLVIKVPSEKVFLNEMGDLECITTAFSHWIRPYKIKTLDSTYDLINLKWYDNKTGKEWVVNYETMEYELK